MEISPNSSQERLLVADLQPEFCDAVAGQQTPSQFLTALWSLHHSAESTLRALPQSSDWTRQHHRKRSA